MDVFRGFFLSILPVVVCGGCGCGWFGIDGFGFDRFWSIGLWTPYSRPLSFRSVDGLGTYGVCMHACMHVCMYVVVLGITTYIYSMHTFGWLGCLGWRWCFMIPVLHTIHMDSHIQSGACYCFPAELGSSCGGTKWTNVEWSWDDLDLIPGWLIVWLIDCLFVCHDVSVLLVCMYICSQCNRHVVIIHLNERWVLNTGEEEMEANMECNWVYIPT